MKIDNRVFESYTVEFSSPLTDEDWEKLEDVDFDHTEHVWFHTKNGKEVHFYKNAIPVEWIKKQAFEHPQLNRNLFYQMIIEQWENENEENIHD